MASFQLTRGLKSVNMISDNQFKPVSSQRLTCGCTEAGAERLARALESDLEFAKLTVLIDDDWLLERGWLRVGTVPSLYSGEFRSGEERVERVRPPAEARLEEREGTAPGNGASGCAVCGELEWAEIRVDEAVEPGVCTTLGS